MADPAGPDWIPLNPHQGLIWADEQLFPESRRFRRTLVISIKGSVDRSRLQAAWKGVLSAHDAFRIVVDAKNPRQYFATLEPEVGETVLPAGSSIDDWILKFSERDVDPSRPRWDLCLLTDTEGQVHCILGVHYLVCDEGSLALVAKEVCLRYAGLPVQQALSYQSFLAQGRQPAALEKEDQDASAWQKALANPPPSTILLGCDGSGKSSENSFVGTGLSVASASLLDGLAAELVAAGVPSVLAMDCIVCTATFVLINRLSGQQDIVISAPFDPREDGASPLIGLVERRVLLRAQIDEGDTFKTILSKVGKCWDFASNHRLASIGSEYESAFVGALANFPTNFCGLEADFRIQHAPPRGVEGKGPNGLTLRWSRQQDSSLLRFDYPQGVFPDEVRVRIASYFSSVFEALLADPSKDIQSVDIVSTTEADQLLAIGTGSQVGHVEDFLATINRQTALRPDSPAVEFNGRPVSYAELDRCTNRLARRLKSLGVVTGSRVAVAMPRGFGEFMSILAVIKAGGAFVPVDPAHPIERVRVILEDAQPQVLIRPVDSPIAQALPQGVPSLTLDDPLLEGIEVDDGPLNLPVDPEQKAYIIFTSGSTGRPKGVEITRGGISNFLQSVAKQPGLGPTDRLAAISTTTFDMSELDFFLPLCVGATVVIAERAHALDPVLLRSLLEDRKVTVMQATPTTWRMLLDANWKGHASFKVFTGGEPISLALAHRLLDCCAELWNLFGPTETSVYSTIDRITKADGRVTVGRAIDNTQITLRDPLGRLVPRFAIGEICISGRGLALGYYGRPDLTLERFPTELSTGKRYYRTGDLGRYFPDGRLECLGRVDFQVKVRGFRIEPADIEAHLRKVAGVSDVLVLALRQGDGDPQLVAYWVGAASKEDLRDRAKAELPHYMIPSSYVHLEAFPVNTSGKVDRKQLPAPEAQASDEVSGTAPRNDQESIVASIWREVLGLAFVPVDEDFFSLGGTSVRVIQMRSRLQDAFGVEVSLKVLFDHPTVETIVKSLGDQFDDDSAIVSRLSKGLDPIPWIGLMGIQLFDDLASSLGARYTTLAIHVPIRYVAGVDPFPTVTEIARRYVNTIREQQPSGPYFLFGLCHGGIVAFEVAAQLEGAGEQVGLVVLLDAELPSARRTLPMLRLASAVKDLLNEPLAKTKRILEKLSGKLFHSWRSPAELVSPVPLSPDAAGIDADLVTYESLGRRVRCDVITFRAIGNDALAPWSVVSADLGWTGRAGLVRSHDIVSDHLGIVRGTHAHEVAQLMTNMRQEIELAVRGKPQV